MADDDKSVADILEDVFAAGKEAYEYYEENVADKVEDTQADGTVSLDMPDRLAEVHVDDEKALFLAEIDEGGFMDVGMEEVDDGVIYTIGDETIKAEIPKQVNIDKADVQVNNKVLRVWMPVESDTDGPGRMDIDEIVSDPDSGVEEADPIVEVPDEDGDADVSTDATIEDMHSDNDDETEDGE